MVLNPDHWNEDQVSASMTITLELELSIGLLVRQRIARRVSSVVGHRQCVARCVNVRHSCVHEVDNVTYLPTLDNALQFQGPR